MNKSYDLMWAADC